MNILIVTNLWSGTKPFFLEGDERFYGLPSFSIPFLKILSSKEFERVHVMLFVKLTETTKKIQINIPKKYEEKIVVYPFYYKRYRDLLVHLPLAVLKAGLIAKKNNISVIFGHGSVSAIAGLSSVIFGIKNIRRLYGIDPKLLTKSRIQLLVSNPLEFLAFTLPCDALIVTNDGSHGNILFNKLNPKQPKVKRFFFELNAVHKNIETRIEKPRNIKNLPKDYISYIARFDTWKGQMHLLKALSILKSRGVEIPVIMVGQIYDKDYYENILKMIDSLGLRETVMIIHGLPWSEAMYILANSTISCVLYDFSLSNVFLESLSLGVPLIAVNSNNSLDEIPDEIFVKLPETALKNPEIIANAIEELLKNQEKRKFLSEASKNFVSRNLKDWEERADFEISLIMMAAKGNTH